MQRGKDKKRVKGVVAALLCPVQAFCGKDLKLASGNY